MRCRPVDNDRSTGRSRRMANPQGVEYWPSGRHLRMEAEDRVQTNMWREFQVVAPPTNNVLPSQNRIRARQ